MAPLFLLFSLSLHVFRSAAAVASWCYPRQSTDSFKCVEPNEWGNISEHCAGSKQSPINIDTRTAIYKDTLIPFQFQGYDIPNSWTLMNDGHSAKMLLGENLQITGGNLNGSYKVLQLHLHWGDKGSGGAEHTINGERSPMELHIVHMSTKYSSFEEAVKKSDGLAVLGFLYREEKSDNPKYKSFIEALKKIPDKDNATPLQSLSLNSLIPEQSHLFRYYRYEGSLTTPNCNEAVIWTLFEERIPLSNKQLEVFFNHLYFPQNGNEPKIAMSLNYRPLQKLGQRSLYTSNAAALLPYSHILLISSLMIFLMTLVYC